MGHKTREPSNHGKKWSGEHLLLVQEQYGRGMGVAQIAEDAGRSRWAVAIKLFEAGQLGAEHLREYAPSDQTLEYFLASTSKRSPEGVFNSAITVREDVDLVQLAHQAWDNAKAL